MAHHLSLAHLRQTTLVQVKSLNFPCLNVHWPAVSMAACCEAPGPWTQTPTLERRSPHIWHIVRLVRDEWMTLARSRHGRKLGQQLVRVVIEYLLCPSFAAVSFCDWGKLGQRAPQQLWNGCCGRRARSVFAGSIRCVTPLKLMSGRQREPT
jgi:hypothetical protein